MSKDIEETMRGLDSIVGKMMTERDAEIARLTAELAAARAVPADVEAAIDRLNYAAITLGSVRALAPTGEVRAKARDDARNDLRIAIARAISDAEGKARSNALRTAFGAAPNESLGEAVVRATAARGTVGGLLATAREGEIVEFDEGSWWMQIAVFGGVVRWRVHDADADGWHPYIDDPSSWHCDELVAFWLAMPARLVTAAEADADPSQRGPLPKGG